MQSISTKESLPAVFVQQMHELLGSELNDFLESLDSPAPVSIRSNPLKPVSMPDTMGKVPWCHQGYYLPERILFTLDPSFHAGGYYVQEASSMLIGQAVTQYLPSNQPVRALDLCAAPGGKSTLLASLLPEGSLLLCNEVIRSRYQILRENLIKWGSPMLHSSQQDSSYFKELNEFFDFILVDAPCSGEGLFRKDPLAIKEWSAETVQHCAARQKRILADAVELLSPGGVLCYSTCTYNDQENTLNARWLTETFGLEELRLELVPEWGVVARSTGYQCFPHKVTGEGLYLACFRKSGNKPPNQHLKWKGDKHFLPLPGRLQSRMGEWLREADTSLKFFQNEMGQVYALPNSQIQDLLCIRDRLKKANIGLWVGTFKREDFVPSPDLALSTWLNDQLPRIELTLEESLLFLKKENVDAGPVLFREGWILASYQGHPMGWVKKLKNRMNNYYPKEWRIRMNINDYLV